MRREVARPIVASVDSRKTPERRSDARKRRRFPRLFTPSAEKSREKVQHRSRDRDRFCGSDTPTVREPFFSREPRSPFLPRALSPRSTTLHTSSVRAQGTPRSCPNARPARFSASPSRSETSRRGLVRSRIALTRLFVHPSLGFSNAAPLSLRWRPQPSRKTSPPRWSCRTWYAREIFPPFGGSPVRYRDASSRDARPPRAHASWANSPSGAPEKPNGERFFSRNRNQRVRVSGVLSARFRV